jgi:Zn finger protein HypA/HybF involved in hydrogenase expression
MMTTEQEFTCSNCGHRDDTKTISYDPLGFPVCPACNEIHGPVRPAAD